MFNTINHIKLSKDPVDFIKHLFDIRKPLYRIKPCYLTLHGY